MVNNNLVGGWPTPLKHMKVSWDDDIPNIWKIEFMFQTTNQNIKNIEIYGNYRILANEQGYHGGYVINKIG